MTFDIVYGAGTLTFTRTIVDPRLRPLSVQNGNCRDRSPSPPEFGSEEEKRRMKRKFRLVERFIR